MRPSLAAARRPIRARRVPRSAVGVRCAAPRQRCAGEGRDQERVRGVRAPSVQQHAHAHGARTLTAAWLGLRRRWLRHSVLATARVSVCVCARVRVCVHVCVPVHVRVSASARAFDWLRASARARRRRWSSHACARARERRAAQVPRPRLRREDQGERHQPGSLRARVSACVRVPAGARACAPVRVCARVCV
jgi:hypothetical protein